MKQEVFEGLIDGKKFDDPIKFKEYLEQHKDAKNVNYSHSIREVADRPTNAVVESNKKEHQQDTKKEQNDKQCLYPPLIDVDQFLSDPTNDVNEIEEEFKEYLVNHRQTIEDLDADELANHRDTLYQIRRTTKETLKQNQRAMDIVEDKILVLNQRIKEYTEKIDEAKSQLQQRRDRLQILKAADRILGTEYRTVKDAIVDVERQYDNVNEDKQDTNNPLQELIDCIYSFC